MQRKYAIFLLLIVILFFPALGWGLPASSPKSAELPIVIVFVDKLDSMELFDSGLPAIKKFLTAGTCGLMNIRSSKGYTNTGSGYLSLGAGSRGNASGQPANSLIIEQSMISSPSASYTHWELGIPLKPRSDNSMIVPEMGWLLNLAKLEDHPIIPGRLGTLFQIEGWRTCLIGNMDSPDQENRPDGLFLMNRQGLIDEGNINNSLNESDPDFPYLYRVSVAKMVTELRLHLAEQKIIALDFGDFARLDNYRDQMSPTLYARVKLQTWRRLNLLMEQILQLGAPEHFTTILISPSISKEGVATKNLLAPIVIYSRDYSPGLLVSGTTRWPGLVANIDLLPTLANIAHLKKLNSFSGKTMTYLIQPDSLATLRRLNERLIVTNTNQRPIINWYQGIISFCWIAGLLSTIYLKKRWIGDWLISIVTVIPLSLITLPLFPIFAWHLVGFLGLTLLFAILFTRLKEIDARILILSGTIWLILIIDQLISWPLIRFSPLGYSAMAGSRYYGLGNEFLGILLAAALLFTHLLNRKIKTQWLAPVILGLTILILSWPQFGAKFGGILAGTAGFAYYLMGLYHWKLNNSKLWFALIGCCLVLFSIGWWDSMRPPDVQTHIGRFLHLLISKDFGQVGQIIFRKIAMNLKLTIFSPWIRIILLALTLGITNRLLTAQKMILPEDRLVWQAIMVAGITAYLVNDAGVLAFATCLAYGFSFVLLKNKIIIAHSH
jgi:hypothetical protein